MMNFVTHQVAPGLDELDLTAFMIITQHANLNQTILPKHIIELDLPFSGHNVPRPSRKGTIRRKTNQMDENTAWRRSGRGHTGADALARGISEDIPLSPVCKYPD
jgi:hypothetical protein